MMSISTQLKNGLKTILYHSGLASRLGGGATDKALTVVMFHRILPQDDARSRTADRTYTIDLAVFNDFLHFLKREYQPVSLNQVEDAVRGRGALPFRAVLVTFDDGWEDTARYAAPALAKQGIPSVVFVTSDVLSREATLWRDVAAIISRMEPSFDPQLEGMLEDERNEVLAKALDRAGDAVRPLMMCARDLTSIPDLGMAIGAHGVSHTPLTDIERPDDELGQSKLRLEAVTGTGISSFAFPHGRYNPAVLKQAFDTGYQLIFTSDPILNVLQDGRLPSPVLGRVALSQADIVDEQGRFSAGRTAFFLMSRKAGVLDRHQGSSNGYG